MVNSVFLFIYLFFFYFIIFFSPFFVICKTKILCAAIQQLQVFQELKLVLYVDIMPLIFCFIFVVFLFKINSAVVCDFLAHLSSAQDELL